MSSAKPRNTADIPVLTVLFIEQTPGGELARRLQKVEERMAAITGYRVRIAETSGSQLRRLLPNTNPWVGADCGRGQCYTCPQCSDVLEDCKRRNILYESYCMLCNPDLEDKKVMKKKKMSEIRGVYVGESGRSIYERAGEHWADKQKLSQDSHMIKNLADSHG